MPGRCQAREDAQPDIRLRRLGRRASRPGRYPPTLAPRRARSSGALATSATAATKAAAATTAATSTKLAWPVAGNVRRGFTARGAGSPHDGIDITAAAGTAVRSAAAGKVIFAGTKGDYGNLVVVEHGPKLHTAYGFLSQITVKPGEQVNRGERIGMVGRTGLAKGDELHFEVRRSDKPVDPKGELAEKP